MATLVVLLQDPSPDVRRTAAMALGKIGLTKAVRPLIGALEDPDPLVREYGAVALGRLGEGVLDRAGVPLARRLADSNEFVRRAAARSLGALGATQAVVELVVEALARPEPEIRRAAVQALMGLEAHSAYPTLVTALQDEDGRVRQGALAAMGEMAEYAAVPLFEGRLQQDPDVGVRSEAAFRLGKLGSREHLPVLMRAAQEDRASVVRRWAEWAVTQIRSVAGSD